MTAHLGINRRIVGYLATARMTPCSERNAERLLAAYQRAFVGDNEISRRLSGESGGGIDGLTEPQTLDGMHAQLSMPDTVTVEIPDPDDPVAAPLAFLTTRFATQDEPMIERFASYFLGDVFDPQRLRFDTAADRSLLETSIRKGNVVYLAEFVSSTSKAATLAVLVTGFATATWHLGTRSFTVLGKCLESASAGSSRNSNGNGPVKRLGTSLGLKKIGQATQTRVISDRSGQSRSVDLEFGLYIGKSDVFRMTAEAWQPSVPEPAHIVQGRGAE